MIIRAAEKKDFKAISKMGKLKEFQNLEYFEPWYLKNFLDDNFFLVAEEDKKIRGFLMAEPLKSRGIMLWFMVVDKTLRSKGIGSKLIKKFETNCKKNKINWVLLHSPAKSKKAQKFYKNTGYEKALEVVEYVKLLW